MNATGRASFDNEPPIESSRGNIDQQIGGGEGSAAGAPEDFSLAVSGKSTAKAAE